MELKNFFAQDDAGNMLAGATCYLYERGTESLVEVLQGPNGLPLGNPFVTDRQGLGQFSAPNGLYDLRVVKDIRDYRIRLQFNDVTETAEIAENAARVLEGKLRDPTGPNNGAIKLGRGVVAIATMEDLIAIAASGRREDLRYLNAEYANGTGVGGGQWFWDPSDCSALVASDPLRGLYAAPLDAPTGGKGAFRRIFADDMDASWFGVVYGKTVDALPALTAAAVLVKQGLSLIASGDILLSGTWNLFGLPPETLSRITILGIIYAAAGDFTPVKISGQRYKFRTLGMTRLGGARTGRPMEIRSTFGAEVSLGFVDKFDQGALGVGERGHAGINGIGWLKFEANTINVAGTCFLGTTELGGWFNESKIEIASLYGTDGIHFKEGVGQTSRFDGIKIIKPGYEKISGTCQALEFATRTTTEDWRIESATGTVAFSEDEGCSRNVYRGSWAVVDTKLRLNGILSRFEAQIIDANGATRAVSAQQGADGEWSYESVAAGANTAFANSIDLRVKTPGVGLPMRLNVKDPNGNAGYIEVKKDRTDQEVLHGTPSASVLPGTTLVMVSLGQGGAPLTLTMDLGLEYLGCTIFLNVSSYISSNPLTIKKSTGSSTAGAGVTSAGLYSLAFVRDLWLISKIGEPYRP